MSLTEDPWRLNASRDHILCGAFKKRPLGGSGHIRVLAHFPKGQKIIRFTEPNSANPFHNYTHKSNKLCHITGKLNYYSEAFCYFEKSLNSRFIQEKKKRGEKPPRRESEVLEVAHAGVHAHIDAHALEPRGRVMLSCSLLLCLTPR